MSASRRAFLQAAAASVPLHAAGKPPNIAYLHSHDTGRYLRPYGHATPTPNIQRMAAEGVLFR
jgi:arylsulfatase A-like enzyme